MNIGNDNECSEIETYEIEEKRKELTFDATFSAW